MTARGFCLAMGEASSTILQPPAAELLFRNGFDLNRRSLDLNVHAFDLSDLSLFHRPSTFFFTPDSSSFPFYYPLPFPPPPPSDLFHHQLRDYWSRPLPSWHTPFHKPQPPPSPSPLPKHDPPSFHTPDRLAIVNSHPHPSDTPNSLLPLSSDAAPTPPPDLYAKYTIESPAWLPLGWITEVQTRRTGTTAGTRDKYYKDPVSGRRFRSRNEVFHFLETGKGRVRRRYKRRIMNSQSTADTAGATTKVASTGGKANVTETGCQPVSSLAYSKAPEPHTISKDASFNALSVAVTIPPVKEKLLQQSQRPNTFQSPAPETPAVSLPPNPKACLKPAITSRKRCPQDRSQKAPVNKKVRFESARIDAERQDSKLWQWLQKPVGQGATRNGYQEKKPEQRLEVMEATVARNKGRPKESARVGVVGNRQQAGLKCGFLRRNATVAIDEELYILIQKPGLTSRQRARLVQKFKAKRAKKLLAILGRKICCQLLGLPVR